MSWADAKDKLADVLATVAITSPAAITIARVYSDPPGQVADLPCIIIYPPALTVRWQNSIEYKAYRARIRLVVKDADLAQAASLVDAFREALIDALSGSIKLGGGATVLNGTEVEEASDFEIPGGSGKHYTGFDAFLPVNIQQGKALTA